MESKNKVENAVILLGGSGTRLRPFSLFNPKCMYPFRQHKIIDEILQTLFDNNIKNIYLSVSEKNYEIINKYLNRKYFDYFTDKLIIEDESCGTAGWMKWIKPFKDTFLVLNGDDLLDISLNEPLSYHKATRTDVNILSEHHHMATIIMTEKKDISDSGYIEWIPYYNNEYGPISRFREKPNIKKSGLISTGWYLLEPQVFDMVRRFDKDFIMFETDVFPEINRLGRLYGYKSACQWFPTGNYKEISTAVKQWQEHK